MMKSKIKLIIADDHELIRDGLLLMLQKQDNFDVVGVAKNGIELLDLCQAKKPDIALVDIQMPKLDGIEATREMLKKDPEIGVVALSMYDDEFFIFQMLQAGAMGYVFKGSDKAEIIDAINHVYRGENYYCRTTTKDLIKKIFNQKLKPLVSLDDKNIFNSKEIKIIEMICEELSSKEIAIKLDENIRTIEGIRRRIMQKLNVKSTIGVVLYAVQNGMYTPKA